MSFQDVQGRNVESRFSEFSCSTQDTFTQTCCEQGHNAESRSSNNKVMAILCNQTGKPTCCS